MLGKLSSEKFSGQRCVIERYVAEKDRWAVKLWPPHFKGEKILVREHNINFDCYAVADDEIAQLPTHLRVSPTPDCGNGLFCDNDMEEGQIVFEENPMMVVANLGGDRNFEARWNLYHALEQDRGQKSTVLTEFLKFADGGKTFTDGYLADSKTLFINVLTATGRSPADIQQFCANMPDFVEEEAHRIAGVLARWQTNSHSFDTTVHDQSSLFRFAGKMQHSCEPNCILTVDSCTGWVVYKTLRNISSGEQLTNDYMGGDPTFHALDVKGRRSRLRCRGFVCLCSRCVRECAESPSA